MADAQSEVHPVTPASAAAAAAAEVEEEEDLSHYCVLVVRFSTSTVLDFRIRMSLPRPSSAATAASMTYAETASIWLPMLFPGATANDLKRLIRKHLPEQLSRNRLRLIYTGRLVPDGAPLKSVLGDVALGINRGPPRDGGGRGCDRGKTQGVYKSTLHARNAVEASELEMKRKGKEKQTEVIEDKAEGQGTTTYARTVVSGAFVERCIYIHCSIGHEPEIGPDALSVQAQPEMSSTMLQSQQFQQPQGFDRLLAPNFTPDDVTNLRTQFRSLLSYTHDQMPSRTVQRALEERWLDGGSGDGELPSSTAAEAEGVARRGNRTAFTTTTNATNHNIPYNAANPAPSTTSNNYNYTTEPSLNTNRASYSTDINMSLIDTDTLQDVTDENNPNNETTTIADPDAESDTSLEDILLGTVLGFFWPVGALVWGLREDNIWTRRQQVSVLTGVLLNLAFGFSKMTI